MRADLELDPEIREAILRAGVIGLEHGRSEAGRRLAEAEEEADRAGRALDVINEGLARLRVMVRERHGDDARETIDWLRTVAATRSIAAPSPVDQGDDDAPRT